jgi:DNA mismatch repair protein MLH3
MPTNDVCISRLPPDVAKEIQASVSITNLNDVVVELVKNSLDSGARLISVSLDYVLGGCVVQDDGHGISSEAFQEGCGFGLPHREYNLAL